MKYPLCPFTPGVKRQSVESCHPFLCSHKALVLAVPGLPYLCIGKSPWHVQNQCARLRFPQGRASAAAMRNQENVIDAIRLMEHPLCRERTFAGAAGCLRGQALISVFPQGRRGRMSYFPTTASESSTDQDTMKHPWRAMTNPRSTVWMGGPGKEATSADAGHMTANRMIPLSCHDSEQTMGGVPLPQSARDSSDYF